MSLSLKLQLNSSNRVTVTNSINKEQKEVTLSFIQKITKNSLNLLIQYNFYEILIDAQSVWNQINDFDYQTETAKEMRVERKFQEMMTPSSYIEITEYDKQQYRKAFRITKIYNRNTRVAKTTEVIRRLKEFDWQIMDVEIDYITMFNYEKQTYLFVPNDHEINQETLVRLINQAKLSVSEFLSPI